MKSLRSLGIGLLLGVSICTPAIAAYPEKAVRIVVGFAAAGPTDVVARLAAEKLAQLNGQPFIVDNKPGAAAMIASLASVSAHLRAGKLKMLAVAAPARVAEFRSVRTFAEAGYPTVSISAWAGLLAPSKTPRPVLEKLAAQLQQVVAMPDVRQRLQTLGMTPGGAQLADFDARIASEMSTFGRIAKQRAILADE